MCTCGRSTCMVWTMVGCIDACAGAYVQESDDGDDRWDTYMRGTWPGCHFPLRPHLGQNAGYSGETSSKSWSLHLHAYILGLHSHACMATTRPAEPVQCSVPGWWYSRSRSPCMQRQWPLVRACSFIHMHALGATYMSATYPTNYNVMQPSVSELYM